MTIGCSVCIENSTILHSSYGWQQKMEELHLITRTNAVKRKQGQKENSTETLNVCKVQRITESASATSNGDAQVKQNHQGKMLLFREFLPELFSYVDNPYVFRRIFRSANRIFCKELSRSSYTLPIVVARDLDFDGPPSCISIGDNNTVLKCEEHPLLPPFKNSKGFWCAVPSRVETVHDIKDMLQYFLQYSGSEDKIRIFVANVIVANVTYYRQQVENSNSDVIKHLSEFLKKTLKGSDLCLDISRISRSRGASLYDKYSNYDGLVYRYDLQNGFDLLNSFSQSNKSETWRPVYTKLLNRIMLNRDSPGVFLRELFLAYEETIERLDIESMDALLDLVDKDFYFNVPPKYSKVVSLASDVLIPGNGVVRVVRIDRDALSQVQSMVPETQGIHLSDYGIYLSDYVDSIIAGENHDFS